jgi:hypothetical protein
LKRNWDRFVQIAGRVNSVVFPRTEQPELRRVARGIGNAEMAEGVRGQ